MGNLHLTDLGELLSGAWPVLLIGLTAAGAAFAVGWTTMRKRSRRPASGALFPAADHDPFAEGGANERRAAARREGHPVTVELVEPDAQQASQQGWVLNRSLGGLCLRVPHAVPIGSLWKVRPTDAPRTTPPVRVEVKTCVSMGAEWALNCQFEKAPSYAVLLMFG